MNCSITSTTEEGRFNDIGFVYYGSQNDDYPEYDDAKHSLVLPGAMDVKGRKRLPLTPSNKARLLAAVDDFVAVLEKGLPMVVGSEPDWCAARCITCMEHSIANMAEVRRLVVEMPTEPSLMPRVNHNNRRLEPGRQYCQPKAIEAVLADEKV